MEGRADLGPVLGPSPYLTNLQLGNNVLEDACVSPLCAVLQLPGCRIQTLALMECGITGLCPGDLFSLWNSCQSLVELDLSGNDLEAAGVRQLWEGLTRSDCNIQKLDVSGCCLAGSHWEGLASALKASRSLTELDLCGGDLGEGGMRELCEGLKHPCCTLQKLHIRGCSIPPAACTDLSSLFSVNRSLTQLDLSSNALGDSGMRELCGGLAHPDRTLQKLEMWTCSLTGSCCADLASLLKTSRSLKELILNNNELGDSGVGQLCEGLKHPGCRLQRLELAGCALTASCCEDLCSALRTNQHLTALALSDNDLGDSGAGCLWDGLKHPSCRIQTLLMDNCSFTSSSCRDIASLFRSNDSLTELDLGASELGDSGVRLLCEGWNDAGCNIQTLGLESCSLTGSGCAALASVLRTSASLTELRLTGNKIGDSGVRHLCDGLESPGCTLQKLHLQHCSLTGLCCEYLSSALTSNPSLRELEMGFNSLGDSGLKLLSSGLKHRNCKLHKLRLYECSLTASCCADLSCALSVNQSLTRLELHSNALGDSGVRRLWAGLSHPECRLQKLELGNCSLTGSCCGDRCPILGPDQSLVQMECNVNEPHGLDHPSRESQELKSLVRH